MASDTGGGLHAADRSTAVLRCYPGASDIFAYQPLHDQFDTGHCASRPPFTSRASCWPHFSKRGGRAAVATSARGRCHRRRQRLFFRGRKRGLIEDFRYPLDEDSNFGGKVPVVWVYGG